MQANPLLGGTSKAPASAPPAASGEQRVVTLASNVTADKIVGLERFLKAFNSAEVRAEVSPFRHVIQRKVRRSMGGKFGKGLSHEVTESLEINPNEDLFGLRRWLGGIRQDPSSVMLLNVNKVKEEPLAAPLAFTEMLKAGRPILVAGADRATQDQLLAKIDLSCTHVPDTIRANASLKTMLLARVQRRKGFISTIRHLLDLEFLPAEVQEKVNKINGGGDPTELNEPETVNLCLLADLASRYRTLLQTYKEALDGATMNVQQLTSMFEMLMGDVPLKEALVSFDEFLGRPDERPEEVRSKGELFGYLNRFINATEGSSRAATRTEKLEQVFKRLTSVVIGQRAKMDPLLWQRCSFIYEPDPDEAEMIAAMEPLLLYIEKTRDQGTSAVTPEFKQRLGEVVFGFVTLSNQSLDQAQNNASALSRQRVAGHLLPLFQMAKFQASHLVQISENNRATLLNKEKFLGLFKNIPVSAEDLQGLAERLRGVVYRDQQIIDAVRKSTLDVIVGHAKDREKALREIYIVNASQELINYAFHIGDQNVSSLDRLCGVAVMQARFGFDVGLQPQRPNSVGLFTDAKMPPLGTLQNEPSVLSHAYTALIGMQLERHVKRVTDHKIGYLMQTFGENFFEVVYRTVVTKHDLPLSRNQFAWFVKERGLLGSLSEKGFKSERENDLSDSFMTLQEMTLSRNRPERDFREFEKFPEQFKAATQGFKQLLAELRGAGDQPVESNIRALLWSLYRKGIYNMDRAEAREAFRKSEFYTHLRDTIAKISSENYSVFTRDIQADGVKLYVIPKFHSLLTLGTRFAYLVESKVVRYQLIASPAETLEELDQVSRVFNEKLAQLQGEEGTEEARKMFAAAEEVQRATNIWREHSRHLAFALLDRILTETVIKQLRPGKVQAQNLWYLPDAAKLCLGPSLSTRATVPFVKILQVPENMGSIQKNPKTASTTIDDFTIEVHKIDRLRDELDHYASVCEDVLDIVQNLTHERAEGQLVGRYEQGLQQMIRILAKPLRHYTEKDVQNLHAVANLMRNTLQAFYATPGSQKDQLVMRVQSQLQARRSDGHQLKLNFSDVFILEKTEIRVTQRVQQGEEKVTRQRKVEVEVDAQYQTLSTRIREVVRMHEVLAGKRFIVLSPEGQKKKQTDYVLDIINVLQSLRGNALTFFVDSTTMTDGQMHLLAAHVKPHNFFRMDDIKPEAPEGVKTEAAKDPLSGRLVRKAPGAAPAADAQASA